MKKVVIKIVGLLSLIALLSSCNEWVKPNHEGVMMEDYGKNGKSDFHRVSGKVSTWTAGTELFQVPLYEQKGDYGDKLTISSTDNTDFYVNPVYTYKVKPGEGVNIVFNYKHLGQNINLDIIEDQILDPRIKDIAREISNSLSDEQLMNNGGKLKYEKACTDSLRKIFDKAGFELLTYSSQLSFTPEMKAKIAERNKVEGESAILDKKLANTKKEIELANLNSEANRARSQGVTALLMQEKELDIKEKAIEGWVKAGCPMPQYVNQNGFYDIVNIKKK
jgi:hypothetical protein